MSGRQDAYDEIVIDSPPSERAMMAPARGSHDQRGSIDDDRFVAEMHVQARPAMGPAHLPRFGQGNG